MDTDRSSRRTGAHARGTAFQARADITFHRGFRAFRRFDTAHALEERQLRSLLRHLDDAVGAVLFTIATANAGLVYKNFTVGQAMNGGGRTIAHAMRMLAVAARG